MIDGAKLTEDIFRNLLDISLFNDQFVVLQLMLGRGARRIDHRSDLYRAKFLKMSSVNLAP